MDGLTSGHREWHLFGSNSSWEGSAAALALNDFAHVDSQCFGDALKGREKNRFSVFSASDGHHV